MTKVFIDTLGCAKNEYDSQVLAAKLIDRGCAITLDSEEADILIVNTCGFIDDAKRESIERILQLSDNYAGRKKLVVTGCLSERYHKELAEELPEVDLFFGVNDYDDMPDMLLENAGEDGVKNSIDELDLRDKVGAQLDYLPYRKRDYRKSEFREDGHYGYLKIAEGCNNACSFCAIPLIRGPYRSKRIEDCVREAEDMAANGIKELILIAQDTSQYGIDLYGELKLPELLKRLCLVEGIEWIRLMYVYDNSITDDLIDVIAGEDKICKYIDMPIQHISDNVLRMMKRQSTGDSIRSVINKLRERIPDVHIRTTLLVGFPGETDDDISELLGFINNTDIDRLGAFAFSDEEGTPSYKLEGKLGDEVAASRRDLVMEHQLAVSERLNEAKIGKVYEVIIDGCLEIDADPADYTERSIDSPEFESLRSAESISLYEGRTRYDAPEIDCTVTIFSGRDDLDPGDIVKVKITDAYEYDLEGVHI
ncbi:MAG: 30S ribosomal protein S12 methylthiotransferase RimO [Lachnospiraceae bacterium]|nr:30S ribosomal protein S12 methylthiotransferase RimO [Lachnospiraceae bacterium]